MRRGAGTHHVLRVDKPCATAPQQLQQPLLFGFAAQVAFVEHQQGAFAHLGQAAQHAEFAAAQITIHHKQDQIGQHRFGSSIPFPVAALLTGFEDSRGIAQLDRTPEPGQPQAVAVGVGGGAHRCPHRAHLVIEQGPDQRGFAAGAAAKDHHAEISPLQGLLHLLALLLQGLACHVIAELRQLLIDGIEVAAGRFLAAARRCGLACLGLPALAADPWLHQGHQGQHQGANQQQQDRPHQPSRKPVAQLPNQAVDRLHHDRQHHHNHEQAAKDQPQPRAFHGRPSASALLWPAVRMISRQSPAATALV